MHVEQATQAKEQALIDLTMRAKAGIFIYLAVWLVFIFGFDNWELSSTFVLTNTLIIAVMFVVRLVHMNLVTSTREKNTKYLYQFLIGSILVSALHWGVLTAMILAYNNGTSIYHLALIVLPALAMGGASALSISNALRFLYPLVLYFPPLVVFISERDSLSLIYGLCMLISYAYVISASKYSRENYWSSVYNHLIAEQRASELERLSTTDQLTQLKNRMYFDNEYDEEWRRSFRQKAPISIVMIDFDHFKQVNDTYGHLFGDEVLKQASLLITKDLKRPSDSVARYGGEEFVILLPDTDSTGAKTVGERVRRSIETMEIEYKGTIVPITCSVGGASTVPNNENEKTVLLKHADLALYQAKHKGRNQYYAFESVAEDKLINI